MLEELMRQMVQASKNIGNTELEAKFSEAIKLLKRDIVFAASLYLWFVSYAIFSQQKPNFSEWNQRGRGRWTIIYSGT